MAKKKAVVSILEQLDEVSKMTDGELNDVCIDDKRPGIIKQYASAIIQGDIADTLKIIKEVSKMEKPESETSKSKKKAKSIEELAIGDNDEDFYIALIEQNTAQLLRKNISPQETARLTQNLDIFRTKLREIRSRKPKEGSTLERVLKLANAKPNKSKSTSVKKKTTLSKAAGATKRKKTGVSTSKTSKK